MPEIKRFNKGILRKYLQTPAEQWIPIESEDDIHRGMVIRNPAEPENPVYYLYVLTDAAEGGYHLVRALDGTRESKIAPSALARRYQQFAGPTTKTGLPSTRKPAKTPIPPPSKSPAKPKAKDPENAKKIQILKDQMALRKRGQQTLAAREDPPAEREKSEKKLIAKIEERRKKEQQRQFDALANLDEVKVAEEKKLLQAACLALAYAFGEDAPDACDTTYAEIVEHLATDVVLGKFSHKNAVAAIVTRIRSDAEKKNLVATTTAKQDVATTGIDTRLSKVEKDIKSLDKQISRMTTHMENVLKRWEAISPFIPSNSIQYFETAKHKRSPKKGGNIGVISYHTGSVKKIPTDKGLDEIVETQVLFVQNGICIHFKNSVAKQLHIDIAELIGSNPEKVWGYDMDTGECYFDASEEPGYDYVRCFDLTRSRFDQPYVASGGRIKNPKRFLKTISDKFGKDILVAVTTGAELA